MRFDIRTLQQGNKIIGFTEGEDVGLTKNAAGGIATAYVMWLAKKLDKPVFTLKICTGCDPRTSSKELKEGVMTGVQMTGSRNYDAGIATTDAIAAAPIMPYFEFDGAVMVTGGDEPAGINGLQFFTAEGPVEEEVIKSMLDKAYKFAFIGEWFECEPVNVMQMYAAEERRVISEALAGKGGNLKGLHFVVNAEGGSGAYFAGEVLEKLGADITGSENLEHDENLSHRQSKGDRIKTLKVAVADAEADLGIALDPAMESYVAVDADGNEINSTLDIEELIIETAKQKK